MGADVDHRLWLRKQFLAQKMDKQNTESFILEEVQCVEDVDDEQLVEYVFQFEENMEEAVRIELIDSCDETDETDDGPSMAKVQKFCQEQEKENTRKATDRDVKNFSKWLSSNKFELRNIEDIPPKTLNEYMAQYFVFLRKVDGSDYQPGTLLNMFHSFERYLKSVKYFSPDERVSILKHVDFEDCRVALQAKRRQLKKQGLGNRPNRSVALEETEEEIMWQKGVLGSSSAFSMQFSIWFHLTLLMGLRGRDEHRAMRFGDIQIKKDSTGQEYMTLIERNSKTRDGSVPNDSRETQQKIFCSCSTNSDRCVVELWKAFISRRPTDCCSPEDPLYLQAKSDDQISRSHTDIWFKHLPLGANSLGKFLPKACNLAGIEPRGNHGVRATTVQRLRKADIPDDQIIQITGHKSVRTLAVYDTNQLSNDVHQKCQGVLQKSHAAGSAAEVQLPPSQICVTQPNTTSTSTTLSGSIASNVHFAPRPFGLPSMFGGAVFNECTFNFGPSHSENVNIEQ